MQTETILILLFSIAAVVAIAVRQLQVPYTVALVLSGLALGILNLFTSPHLTKELLFPVFLPGLLFEAAFHIEFREFWRNHLRPSNPDGPAGICCSRKKPCDRCLPAGFSRPGGLREVAGGHQCPAVTAGIGRRGKNDRSAARCHERRLSPITLYK